MKDSNGNWMAKPPDYEAIVAEGKSTSSWWVINLACHVSLSLKNSLLGASTAMFMHGFFVLMISCLWHASGKKMVKNCIEKLLTFKLFINDPRKLHANIKDNGCMLCFFMASLVMLCLIN